MAKVAIIGGSGHVGTYLVPRLVGAGHQVDARREPYRPHAYCSTVETLTIDREAAEREGRFGAAIAALEADIVIDLICFRLERCQHPVEALRGKVQHFLHCGTIWGVYGHNAMVPATEDQPLNPFGEYGRKKPPWRLGCWIRPAAMARGYRFSSGHIVGPGGMTISYRTSDRYLRSTLLRNFQPSGWFSRHQKANVTSARSHGRSQNAHLRRSKQTNPRFS
jgi:hypothetical protein